MSTVEEKSQLKKVIGRSVSIQNALLMDAQIMSSKEEFALGMEQKLNYAAVKIVRIMLRKEA